MTGDDDDQGRGSEPPWHHSTPAVLGASVAALAVIALVVWGVVALTSNAGKPQDAPIDFVEPTFASSTSQSSTATTTQTITSTRPPVTTDFDLPSPSETSGTTTSGTDTSGSSTPESSAPTVPTVPPRTRTESPDAGDGSPTSRSRPRTNVTRTLYPVPPN